MLNLADVVADLREHMIATAEAIGDLREQLDQLGPPADNDLDHDHRRDHV